EPRHHGPRHHGHGQRKHPPSMTDRPGPRRGASPLALAVPPLALGGTASGAGRARPRRAGGYGYRVHPVPGQAPGAARSPGTRLVWAGVLAFAAVIASWLVFEAVNGALSLV